MAAERGVRVLAAQEFARQLRAEPQRNTPALGEKPDVRLSEAEIEEWLELFRKRPKQ